MRDIKDCTFDQMPFAPQRDRACEARLALSKTKSTQCWKRGLLLNSRSMKLSRWNDQRLTRATEGDFIANTTVLTSYPNWCFDISRFESPCDFARKQKALLIHVWWVLVEYRRMSIVHVLYIHIYTAYSIHADTVDSGASPEHRTQDACLVKTEFIVPGTAIQVPGTRYSYKWTKS